MSELILVRHGQASFLADNYDQLSELGIRQARMLGAFWARIGLQVDEVYCGTLDRQIHTTRMIGEAFADAGIAFPEPVVMPEFNECQLDILIKEQMGPLMMKYEHIREIIAEFSSIENDAQRFRLYQRAFEAFMDLWVTEEIGSDSVEPWSAFEQRVGTAVESVTANKPSGTRIVAVTSGGPSAIAIKRVLELDTPKALNFMWTKRNSALTEFLFSNGRMTLSSFNAVPHLHDPALWTYR